jgi:hypothetical protein
MFYVVLPFNAMVMSVIIEETKTVFKQSGWIVMCKLLVAFTTPTPGTLMLAVRT